MKKVFLFLVCLGAFLLPALVWAKPYAYITSETDGNVSVIDVASDSVVNTISVGGSPHGVGINPDGTKLYVANSSDNTVSIVDTSITSVIATVDVGISP